MRGAKKQKRQRRAGADKSGSSEHIQREEEKILQRQVKHLK